MKSRLLIAAACVASALVAVHAQAVTKASVPGVVNFSRVETTIACAGATTPAAVADIKKMGFASIVNLREAGEQGADLEGEEAAAKAAGINYIHLPFNTGKPDPAVADQFLKVITDPKNDPAFIHCATANRASAMWMIKRMMIDNWDADRAGTEAAALGLTNGALKTFALTYVQTHKH